MDIGLHKITNEYYTITRKLCCSNDTTQYFTRVILLWLTDGRWRHCLFLLYSAVCLPSFVTLNYTRYVLRYSEAPTLSMTLGARFLIPFHFPHLPSRPFSHSSLSPPSSAAPLGPPFPSCLFRPLLLSLPLPLKCSLDSAEILSCFIEDSFLRVVDRVIFFTAQSQNRHMFTFWAKIRYE